MCATVLHSPVDQRPLVSRALYLRKIPDLPASFCFAFDSWASFDARAFLISYIRNICENTSYRLYMVVLDQARFNIHQPTDVETRTNMEHITRVITVFYTRGI